MKQIADRIEKIGVVPMVTMHHADKAVDTATALLEGGLPCIEITLRTAYGEEAMNRIAKALPGMLLGAGTVLTIEQVDRALAAGAQFAVSPGFNPRVVDYCIKRGLPVFPGCSTPSDMEQAIERELGVVKFFPAEQCGGLAYLKAVAAPYPMLRFLPSGGINTDNLPEYLAEKWVLACGGSWIARREWIETDQYDKIEKAAMQAAGTVTAIREGKTV